MTDDLGNAESVGQPGEVTPDQEKPVPAVAIATVISVAVKNAMILVKCQIEPLGFEQTLRLMMPYLGRGMGMTMLPRAGDELLALFPDGDLRRGVALWGLYNGVDPAPRKTRDDLILLEGRPGDNVRIQIRGGVSVEIELDEDTTIHGSESHVVDQTRDTTIGQAETHHVGASRETLITTTDGLVVGLDRSAVIGGNDTRQVAGNSEATIMQNLAETVVGNRVRVVTGTESITIAKAKTDLFGAAWVVTAIGAITFNAPAINMVLLGAGTRLCNEAFFTYCKENGEGLSGLDQNLHLTQVLRAQ